MKKIIINGQMRNKSFLIVIYHSSLVKAAMNAARVCKMRNGVSKTPSMSSFFNCQRRNEYSPQLSELKYNCKLKTRKRTNTLKGSQRMGAGGFSKNLPRLSL
jgi:hypothetical protein